MIKNKCKYWILSLKKIAVITGYTVQDIINDNHLELDVEAVQMEISCSEHNLEINSSGKKHFQYLTL
jgi:hypothetical protein